MVPRSSPSARRSCWLAAGGVRPIASNSRRAHPRAPFAIADQKFKIKNQQARVAKLADAPDLGSGGAILRGSSPLPGIPSTRQMFVHGIIESFRFTGVAVVVFLAIERKEHLPYFQAEA
jgi:hypothetical protein